MTLHRRKLDVFESPPCHVCGKEITAESCYANKHGELICDKCAAGIATTGLMRGQLQITGELDGLQAKIELQNKVCRALWSLLVNWADHDPECCGDKSKEEIAQGYLQTRMEELENEQR